MKLLAGISVDPTDSCARQRAQAAICQVHPGNHRERGLGCVRGRLQPGAALKQPMWWTNPPGFTNVCSCAPAISMR